VYVCVCAARCSLLHIFFFLLLAIYALSVFSVVLLREYISCRAPACRWRGGGEEEEEEEEVRVVEGEEKGVPD
jgi:hypothetical protein